MSDDIGQTRTELVVSPSSSACTMTPGRGLPMSPCATSNTTSPRYTTSLPDRGQYPANHLWPRPPDAWRASRPRGGFVPAPWDYAGPEPNAAPDAAPARAAVRGATPCAAGEC